jgi:type IV pilus assembly protein PilY1
MKLQFKQSLPLTVLSSGLTLFLALHAPLSAQAAGSSLRQEPISVSIKTKPNVMLMMDDSASMGSTALPPPPGIFGPAIYYPIPKTFSNNSGSTTVLNYVELLDWMPFHNTMAYNAAITYKPWNDNNKPAASNFPNASIGTVNPLTGALLTPTPNDMRMRVQAGVRVAPPTPPRTTDLFTRAPDIDRPGACLTSTTTTSTVTDCLASTPGTTTTTPDPTTEAGVIVTTTPAVCTAYAAPRSVTTTSCTSTSQERRLIEAHYSRFNGNEFEFNDPTKYSLVEIDRSAPSRMYPTPTDPKTGNAVKRLDCVIQTNCTFLEEAQNYANWYTYYRTRMFAAIAITSQVLAETDDKMRIGYGRLNHFANGPQQWPDDPSSAPPATLPTIDGQVNKGHIVRGVRDFIAGTPERQELFDWLFTLNPVGGTPNREAVDAAGQYFSRTDNRGPWANNPGIGDVAGTTQLACRKNITLLTTDGTWTDSPNHPRISALYPGASPSPVESDGVAGALIQGAGNQAGKDYTYTPTSEIGFSTSSSGAPNQNATLSDVTMYYWNRDLRPDLANVNRPTAFLNAGGNNYPNDYANPATWQSMSTFIVGYGLNPTVKPNDARRALELRTPINWPAVNVADPNDNNKVDDSLRAALNSRGDFFAAQTPAELGAALKKVFDRVGSSVGSSTAIAVSTNIVTSTSDLVYEAGYSSETWNGSLNALSAQGILASTVTNVWTANFPTAHTSRKLFTSVAKNSAIAMKWANLTPTQQAAFVDENTFDFLIGDRVNEKPTGVFRERVSVLGSIVNANPIHSKATHFGYQFQPGAAGTTYAAYLDTKRNTRTPVVLVGANDGMMHGFAASDGMELFGYTPRAAQPFMKELADPAYVHRYLVDGTITEGDAYLGGAWKTIAVGSGGAGPTSLFAVDITDPSNIDSSKVLFDLTQADEVDLGKILGGGFIAPTRAGNWVAVFGNGYESTNHQSALLIFDVATGNLIKKFNTGIGADAPGQRNGMGPPTPLFDSQRNLIGVYAGDKLGNLWKYDLTSSSVTSWDVAKVANGPKVRGAKRAGKAATGALFTATDAAGNPQPITTAPRITSHPEGGVYVVFGTGKVFETGDEASTQTQTIYAIRDDVNWGPFLKTKMKPGTLSLTGTGNRSVSGLTGPTGVNWTTDDGWYIDLNVGTGGGERIVASPRLSAGLVTFASFKPTDADPCQVGGTSLVYQFDLAGGFTRETFSGLGADVVGVPAQDGLVGGLTSLFAPGLPPIPKTSISAAELKIQTKDTRYKIIAGKLEDTSAGSLCALVGTSLGKVSISVPTACAGTSPLRVWRDLR